MHLITDCLRDVHIPNTIKHHMDHKSNFQSFKLDIFSDEYKILNKIGEGSFSEVLQCVDKQSGVPVAAKVLKKNFRCMTRAEEMPELIALRKLTRHNNILHMIESHFEPENGKVTLVFELMDMSLYDMIRSRKKPISEAKAKHFLYQIVKGVEHIHYHGIFHRDIKPENILVKGDVVKIADLGSIKGIYSQQPYTEYISTRWYRSPECLLTCGYYGPKMDVWAIGCVFFELLTLKPLFPGSSEVDQIAKIHGILGTPNNRLLAKFKRNKVRNLAVGFPSKQGTGLNPLIPFMSDGGRDLLKQMVVYDPESRINIRRLIEHKYFTELRQSETLQKSSSSWTSLPSVKTTWRNPVFLSYLTNERNKKSKMSHDQKVPNVSYSSESSKVTITQEEPGDWKNAGKCLEKLKEKLNKKEPEQRPGESGENICEDKMKNNLLKRNRISLLTKPPAAKKSICDRIEQNLPKRQNFNEGSSIFTLTKEMAVKKSLRDRFDKKLPKLLDLKDGTRLSSLSKQGSVMKSLRECLEKKPGLVNLRQTSRIVPPALNEGSNKKGLAFQNSLSRVKQQGLSNRLLGTYRSFKKL